MFQLNPDTWLNIYFNADTWLNSLCFLLEIHLSNERPIVKLECQENSWHLAKWLLISSWNSPLQWKTNRWTGVSGEFFHLFIKRIFPPFKSYVNPISASTFSDFLEINYHCWMAKCQAQMKFSMWFFFFMVRPRSLPYCLLFPQWPDYHAVINEASSKYKH